MIRIRSLYRKYFQKRDNATSNTAGVISEVACIASDGTYPRNVLSLPLLGRCFVVLASDRVVCPCTSVVIVHEAIINIANIRKDAASCARCRWPLVLPSMAIVVGTLSSPKTSSYRRDASVVRRGYVTWLPSSLAASLARLNPPGEEHVHAAAERGSGSVGSQRVVVRA